MDTKQITKMVIELIDGRIGAYLRQTNTLQELPASVVSVQETIDKAIVRLLDDSNTELTLYNKTGEVLSVGDTVFVYWRGRMATNTAYIGRRTGTAKYPQPSIGPHIRALTQAEYNALTTIDNECLYIIIEETEGST